MCYRTRKTLNYPANARSKGDSDGGTYRSYLANCSNFFLLRCRNEDQCDASTALFKLHLDAYQFLALDSLAKGRLLWHLRPKFHYSDHLLQWSKSSKMNPQAVSNFMDEDHMKFMSRTGARIHIMFSILVLLMPLNPKLYKLIQPNLQNTQESRRVSTPQLSIWSSREGIF